MKIFRHLLPLCLALFNVNLMAAQTPVQGKAKPMPENVFQNQDMHGARFEKVNLADVRFQNVNLGNAVFDDINLSGATIFNANLSNVKINGANIHGLTVFGFNVQDLIEAERDRQDPAGAPARRLKRATQRGDVDAVREMLDANPSVVTAQTDGWTPFQDAAFHGKAAIIALMLEKVGDISAEEVEGALHHAMQEPFTNPETVEALLASGKVSPIVAAVYRSDLEAMGTLLDAEPRLLEETSASGSTPFLHAAENGLAEAAAYLLDRGANIRATGRGGASALHLCAWNWINPDKRTAMLRLLLQRGADPNTRDERGSTALHRAVSVGLDDSTTVLLESGADVHARNTDGKTPLMLALESGDKNVENILRERGATE